MTEQQTIQCVGFIMDGNRRWAKERGLLSLEGHAAGYTALKNLIPVVHAAHIPHMVCYAFSTENWKRAEEEVGYLMNLLHRALSELRVELERDGRKINLRIIGERNRLPEKLQEEIVTVESQNHVVPELTVWIAISYGGRAEIVHAVQEVLRSGEAVTEETFEKFLWTEGMPDPDIIIRTSGEIRTSNFLIWQSAYSEYFFTDTYWPDFGEIEFKSILEQYANRKRRKGA